MLEQGDDIGITEEPLDVAGIYSTLRDLSSSDDSGAIVVFVGLVREFDSSLRSGRLEVLRLQHYPELTQLSMLEVVQEARARWPLGRVLVRHRVGDLLPADEIVVVGVRSRHRAEAFEAAQFLMDKLKTDVMLWKQVLNAEEARWVAFKDGDAEASNSW